MLPQLKTLFLHGNQLRRNPLLHKLQYLLLPSESPFSQSKPLPNLHRQATRPCLKPQPRTSPSERSSLLCPHLSYWSLSLERKRHTPLAQTDCNERKFHLACKVPSHLWRKNPLKMSNLAPSGCQTQKQETSSALLKFCRKNDLRRRQHRCRSSVQS